MSGNGPGGLMELIRKMFSGDKSPAQPVKPAAPKRPASFYDPPEDAVDTFGTGKPSPFAAPASQAPTAMTGEPRAMQEFGGHPEFPVLPIPAKVASVVEQAGAVTIVYSPRRKLGLAIVVIAIGTVIMGVGLLALLGTRDWTVPLGMILAGLLFDLGGAHILVSNLHVVAGGGRLKVEQLGLFGRKHFEAAGASITRIEPALSYTVTSGGKRTNYYTVTAHSEDAGNIPVGHSVAGEEVADAIAYRIARALRLKPGTVSALGHHESDHDD
ncbi:MAG: hypothetical protein ACRD3R_08095 [Terriglobales bacterium]